MKTSLIPTKSAKQQSICNGQRRMYVDCCLVWFWVHNCNGQSHDQEDTTNITKLYNDIVYYYILLFCASIWLCSEKRQSVKLNLNFNMLGLRLHCCSNKYYFHSSFPQTQCIFVIANALLILSTSAFLLLTNVKKQMGSVTYCKFLRFLWFLRSLVRSCSPSTGIYINYYYMYSLEGATVQ